MNDMSVIHYLTSYWIKNECYKKSNASKSNYDVIFTWNIHLKI